MNTATASRDKGHSTIVKKVSKKGHDEAHGGAWKVAFADFVLALMCLFLVLWILAARSSEQAAEDVRRAQGGKLFEDGGSLIARQERQRGSLIPREPVPAQSDTLQPRKAFANGDTATPEQPYQSQPPVTRRYESAADLRELSAVIVKMAEDTGLQSNLQTLITPFGLRVLLHDTDRIGMFERGNAYPTERFRKLLRQMGPLFAQVENQMLIVGHTDSVPFSGVETYPGSVSNWSLSNSRAMAARFHMMAGGMPTTSVLQVVGMADRAPLESGRADADVNRRIELMVLTTEHAQAIRSMFGQPTGALQFAPGADAVIPERSALQSLRERLGVR
ncbi:flagellar motor protein MotB [Pseudorhodoferax sp.]|uniref:flagellar motor protein MotB n=1 Tax=Pseudorhodoferax sp. TaxID=1993553 RepID=UPI002DD62C25|nr:flagellar motor protein MotB [Pseudorhodoferax sp.]